MTTNETPVLTPALRTALRNIVSQGRATGVAHAVRRKTAALIEAGLVQVSTAPISEGRLVATREGYAALGYEVTDDVSEANAILAIRDYSPYARY